MTFESDLQTVLGSFPEVSDQLQLSRAAAPGQKRLWNESEVEREEKPHDGKRPGEFAPKGKPKTPAGQNLLFDSGVKDHPVVKPAPQPSTLEKIADEQAKTKVSPIDGQKELFSAGLEPVHHHVGKRFGIPPEAVKSLMESGVPELRRRDQWLAESNGTSPQTGFETFPHGTARINQFGDPNESYVDYMTEFSPHEIEPTEPEDGIKKSQTYKDYVQWAKAGHQPPPVSVFSSNNGNGKLLTSSRRRTLAAREAGVEKIPAWHGPYNPETGNPLKYGDVMKAVNEFHSQQFSRTLGEITPVEFSTAAPPRKRRVIDEKRTREDVEEDEKVFGKKKRIPTDGDRPETGWTKVGGSTVHVDDDGVIDKGCPGLKGEAVEDLIDESDESRERREARQAYARAAGITGDQITAAQAKSMGSDAHVEGMKQAKEIAEADPRPTIGTSDVLRGVDDQTGEPAGNGHELLQSNNREHPESNEQFDGTSPMKFTPDEDEGTRPQWMGPKLSEMVPIPPRPKFLRDREPLNHDEAATYQPQIDKLESDIAKWRDARDAMRKGRDIREFGLTPDQKTPEYADAQIKALQGPLGKLKRQLSDYRMRSTPNQNPATQTWTSLDSAAEGASAKFGIPIHHIVEAMPDAYLFRLAQSIEHESLKKSARQKLRMHAGDLARIENQHSDWSDVPHFDESSREFAAENPGAGLDPYAHDTPDKVWSLVREGVTAMPAKDSPEIAELAAQMISGDYNRKPLEFKSEEDEHGGDFADDWGQEEHGDTSFDPNSFSRSLMNVVPIEFSSTPSAPSAAPSTAVSHRTFYHATDKSSAVNMQQNGVDPGSLNKRDSGYFGAGLYTSKEPQNFYGKSIVAVRMKPESKILDVGDINPKAPQPWHGQFAQHIADSMRRHRPGIEQHKIDAEINSVTPGHPTFSHTSYNQEVGRFARNAGYHAASFANGQETVIFHPSHIESIQHVGGLASAKKHRQQMIDSDANQSFSRSILDVGPVEFARVKPARNQSAFNWDESAHPREASVHDGKRPGEFAPSQGVASQQSVDPETDYKQNGTRSKAFKAWFGDWEHDPANASKVVDADGEPQETASIPGEGSKVMKDGKPIGVYHGTGKGGWDKFDKAFISRATSGSDPDLLLYGPGFYFTEDQDVAADYAKIGSKDIYETKASRQELIDIASRSQAALNDEFQLWKNAGMEGDAGHIKHAIGHLENLKSLAKIEKASFESNQDVLRALKNYASMAETPSDPDQAPAKTGHEAIVKRDSGEVKNVYLNIRKPFDIDGKTPVGDIAGLKSAFGEKLGGKIASAYGYTMTGDYGNWSVDNSIVYSAAAELYGGKSAANDNLAKMGFDGITHIGGDRMGGGHHHRVWIAFEPNQIKSVNNRGTFNPEDDRLEFSRSDELDTIAERMGIDVDSLRAAIAAMPGPKSESLIWIRKLMHDPSRGVLRDRNGHVVGFLTRNGQKIQLRDSRGRQSGTVTGSSFRDSKGHVTGTLQEFSQQLQEIEPVEFARIKPAPGQMSLFDERKVNRETTQHENKRPGEFAPKAEPTATPKPQYQPSTPGATVTHGYAGMREGFAIKTPHGAEVNGYTHNADFPGKKSDEKRGELFITTVPKHLRRQGLGSSLAKDALGLMKHHGAERVGISTTSDEGRAMVSSLLRDGHIHGPLSTSQTGKSEYGIGAAPATLPSTVDFPQTNSFEAMKGVHVRRENGVTHFSHPEHKWGLTKVPTSQENRFLDEINGRLSHPANSGHPTLDRVLSGQGKYLGKGHEALVHDAGNGMVVKSAVITPFHINNGTRTPEEANRIIGDTVNLSRELRRRGVPGILPQYGVFHDGRQFAVQPKVDANPKLTDEHIKQLEETLHAVHDAGYVLRDQIQPGLDHNGRASLFDIGSAEKLKGTNQHWDDDDKRSDFNNLQHLANKHGLKYQTPQQRQWDNDYDNLLSRVTSPRSGKEITDPKEAGKIRAQLVTYNRLMKAKDPDMHELYTDHYEAAMKRLNEISPLVKKTINADGTVQFGQLAFNWDEDEHPRDEAGRFKDKLHHQIKEYLSDGSHRHLRDIHDHTGHKDYDALDPLANKANAALKELRDSGQISGTSPSIGEPHFYMTEEQIAKHKTTESVKEKDTDISYKKPVGEEVSSKDELKSKDVGRTRNAIHFDPAIVGPSGATLTSYDWRFEWIVDEEKSDDPIRVSDWNESERNEHTKRQVVHVFHVTDPDGHQHFVSLETAVKLLGLVKKSEDLNKVKSLAQAAIKLAKAKQEHEKLLSDESQKSRYEYKFKVQSSEENIKDLQSKMEFLNSEAAMIGAGKSPVDHYREVARKLQSLIKLYRSDKHGTSQQDRVTEFVKAKGGPSDQQKERRIEGYGHYKKLIAANGMNVLGESKSTTPNVDGEPEMKIFGRTVPAEPAWSDQKMRLWYAKHGKNAEAAIADSHKWLAEHHPDYSILLEHPDFKSLRGEQEFSRLLDITPVEFGRKPAPGQKGFDFDAPATEPIADKAAENEPTKQSSLFADIPAEHLDEAKKLSELHGGREVRKTKTGWQVRSPKGGKVSEVNGTYYPGGQFMPIHGLSKPLPKPPKQEKPALPFTPPKPNENGKSRESRSPMSAEQIAELKSRRESQEKWNSLRSTKLGEMLHLGERPHAIKHSIPFKDWYEFAESVPNERLEQIAAEAKELAADQTLLHEGLAKDSPQRKDYLENAEFYQDDDSQFMTKKHQKLRPASVKALFWIRWALNATDTSRGNKLDGAMDQSEIAQKLAKIVSGESQFSRDLEICLQEFARHEFSSTQFNIRDAGYPRSQGSPLDALVKLAKSIPTEELHEGERSSRDDMHITVKYGLHTNNADEVAKIVRGFGPVTVKLGKTSIFPANEKKSYDVVKVAVTGSDIHRLNKLISASTECTDTWPDFKPHLTIAYVMPGFGRKYSGLDTFEGMELTFDSLQFSNKDREKTEISLVDKTEEFSRLPVLTEEEFEFARRPYKPGEGQGEFPFQDRPDQIDSPLGEEPVQSSNMHSFRWEGNDTTGSLLVRFKAKNGGPGPLYRVSVPKSYYEGLKKTAQTNGSAGGWYWDNIRVRGSVAGHQHPVSLVGTGPTGYVPRAAGLRRGYTGEHFNERTLNGVKSTLAPAPVRKGPAKRIPGYDPSKLKLPGESQGQPSQPQVTTQSQTSSSPSPATAPTQTPTTPQSPSQSPQAPPSTPPNKTKGLIDKVLDFFKRKRKKPDDPKQFSREEWDAYESLVKSGFV